jgi:hypothetical protein
MKNQVCTPTRQKFRVENAIGKVLMVTLYGRRERLKKDSTRREQILCMATFASGMLP